MHPGRPWSYSSSGPVSPHGDNNWLSPRTAPANGLRSVAYRSINLADAHGSVYKLLCITVLRSLSSLMRFRNGRTPELSHHKSEGGHIITCRVPLVSHPLFAPCRVSPSPCAHCQLSRYQCRVSPSPKISMLQQSASKNLLLPQARKKQLELAASQQSI